MSDLKGKVVLIMAGGTGGHVYPALSVAHALHIRGAKVHWLGNEAGFEGRKVPRDLYCFHDARVRALRGKGILGWLKAPFMVYKARARAMAVMREIRPDLVLGMGGFVSGPGGLAARALRIPLFIHEQNAVMGLSNRLLSGFADKVLLAYEEAGNKVKNKEKIVFTGNPVREEIVNLPAPEVRFAQHYGSVRLLVLGGSQGARRLNQLLPQALALLPLGKRPWVVHQVGELMLEETKALYERLGVRGAQVVAFIEDMAKAYTDCDWVLARSGASTVAEVATVGIPALFVPFPYAVDNHQFFNAQGLLSSGAVAVVEEKGLNAEILADLIAMRDVRADLLEQAKALRAYGHGDALAKILQCIEAAIIK